MDAQGPVDRRGIVHLVTHLFANLRVRSKVMLPVIIAAVAIVGLIVVGSGAISSTSQSAQNLYEHAALPLDQLGHVRDAEGDSRVAVREYVLAATAAERAAAVKDAADGDAALDDSVAAFVAAKGSTLSAQNRALLATFTTGIKRWRAIRDDQVFPAAVKSGVGAAQRIIAGPMAAANEVFGGAMDTIDTAEGAAAAAQAHSAQLTASAARRNLILLGLFGLTLCAGIGLAAARGLTRPLAAVGAGLTAMASGDLTSVIQVNSRDEVGRMAQAFIRAQAATVDTVTALERSADALGNSSRQMAEIGQNIASRADAANALATEAADDAARVSTDVQGVAAGAEQMSASITEIAHNSTNASRVATDAVAMAQVTNEMIDRLAAAAASIGSVATTITAVAAQTNLLALNATIEAARAGDAGKGFAVVAGEVKQLAQQSAEASSNISSRIETVTTETSGAIQAINEISTVINRINDFQATIAAAVEQQSATTQEMRRGVSEAANRTNAIAENIARVASSTADTRDSVADSQTTAAELSTLSDDLVALVSRFTI